MTNDKIVVAVEKLAEAVRRYGLKSQQNNNLQDVSRDIKTLPYDILELPENLSVRPRTLTPYVEMAVRGSDAAETFYEDRARKSGRGNPTSGRGPRQLPERMTHLEKEGTRDDW